METRIRTLINLFEYWYLVMNLLINNYNNLLTSYEQRRHSSSSFTFYTHF